MKVTPEEEAQLLRLALAQGVTVPRLLVESALAAEVGETVTERRTLAVELFRCIRLLAAISNNVNQIARATNATGEAQAETAAALLAVRRTAERVKATLEAMDPA
nr:plasmid mobilization relaxosome protein MobC [Actinotalea ferrariae]